MKGNEEVIKEFNEVVNMTASELEAWLKSDDSNSAGWPKDDANGDGESVGHDSGRKIVEILKANPKKNPDKYTDDQVSHMRKVVAYCKRHLAQESSGNKEKSPEEVKKTKSYASLKNWGHDFLKAQGKEGTESKEDEDEDGDEEADDNEEADEEPEEEPKAGDKRKKSAKSSGPNKKRQTRSQTAASKKDQDGEEEDDGNNDDDVSAEDDDDDAEGNGEDNETKATSESENDDGSEKKQSSKGPSKGDTVSWKWGSGHPEGKVLDVKEEKTTIKTKRGNEVSRDGDSKDPAVVLDTGSSKAIKSAHELD